MGIKLFHPIVDVLAALSLAAAVAFVLAYLNVPVGVTAAAAAGTFGAVLGALLRMPFGRAASAGFAPVPLVFDEVDDDVLLLDRPIEISANSSLVRLAQPLPSPGEMHAVIQRHLRGVTPEVHDDTDKLSEALAELRRAIR